LLVPTAPEIACLQVAELSNNGYVEICWYFPTSREQYRLAGTVEIVTENHTDEQLLEARQQAWARMSDSGEKPPVIHCIYSAATSTLPAHAQAFPAFVQSLNKFAFSSNGAQ